MGAPTPTFIPEPFASAAPGANINFPIPAGAPPAPNGASWSLGFPAITMQPEVAGGLPPLGQDFNGILYTITQALYALQAGQFYGFNASFAATLLGYNAGAMLAMVDGTGLWINTTAGNATNPDNDPTAAGWAPAVSYGKTTINGLVGGLLTLTPSQSRRALIVLSGALVSNLTVVLPPNLQQWLIVNNTSGAFSTTVKTAGGTGVVVPQGGPSSPTGVYSDGVSIYADSTPLTVAIAQGPVPLTLVERDNLGQGFFTRLNISSNPAENPNIGSVLVQNVAADGYSRWASFAYFLAQAFNNAALTGVPTCPTAAPGTHTAQIASTAFANPTPPGVLGTSAGGYRVNTDGTIEQWGSFFYGGSLPSQSFVFPTPFLSEVLHINFTSTVGGFVPGWQSNNLNGATAGMSGMGGTQQTIYWRAIGV